MPVPPSSLKANYCRILKLSLININRIIRILLEMGTVPVFGVNHFELSSFVTRLCIKVYNFISTHTHTHIYIYMYVCIRTHGNSAKSQACGNIFNLILVNIILPVTTNLFILVSEKALQSVDINKSHYGNITGS